MATNQGDQLIGSIGTPRPKIVNNVNDTADVLKTNMQVLQSTVANKIINDHFVELQPLLSNADSATGKKALQIVYSQLSYQRIPCVLRKDLLMHNRWTFRDKIIFDIILTKQTDITITSPDGIYQDSINKALESLNNGSTEEK